MSIDKINKSMPSFYYIPILKLNYFLFIIISILNKLKSDVIVNGGSYPIVYTLLDGNQFFIGANSITLYDADFKDSLNQYNLTEDLIVTTTTESIKTSICQFKQNYGAYILLLIKDNLLLFDSTLKMLHKISNISDKLGQQFYDLVPYKKVDNDLYYVICSAGIDDQTKLIINLLYYKINILTGINTEIITMNHNITKTTASNGNLQDHCKTISCQYMSYISGDITNNYLTCFFSITYPSELNALSFNLDKNLEIVSDKKSYITQTLYYSHYIRSTKVNSDSKCFVCYSQGNGKCACCYYDLIANNFTNDIIYFDSSATSLIGMNVKYFKETNEIVISNRDSGINYYITTLNPNNLTVINEKCNYQLSWSVYRYSIIYSPTQSKYLVLYNEYEKSYIEKVDSLGNKTKVDIDEIIKEGEEEIEEILKEEKEEKVEEELIEQKEEREIFEEFEEEILKEEKQEQFEEKLEEEKKVRKILEEYEEREEKIEKIEQENFKEEEQPNEEEKKIEPIKINCEKCSVCSSESWNLNLCISCNKEKNYKEVDFGIYNLFPSTYVECYNSKTKPKNFFYNEITNKYKPYYESCATCSKEGNANIHNCDLCAVDLIKKPDTPGTTNCVPKCESYYYFNSIE